MFSGKLIPAQVASLSICTKGAELGQEITHLGHNAFYGYSEGDPYLTSARRNIAEIREILTTIERDIEANVQPRKRGAA